MVESFAQMFEESLASQRIRPGQILTGRVIEVGPDVVVVQGTEGGGHTGNRQTGDHTVQPKADRHILGDLPHDEPKGDEREHVEGQPEGVGG